MKKEEKSGIWAAPQIRHPLYGVHPFVDNRVAPYRRVLSGPSLLRLYIAYPSNHKGSPTTLEARTALSKP